MHRHLWFDSKQLWRVSDLSWCLIFLIPRIHSRCKLLANLPQTLLLLSLSSKLEDIVLYATLSQKDHDVCVKCRSVSRLFRSHRRDLMTATFDFRTAFQLHGQNRRRIRNFRIFFCSWAIECICYPAILTLHFLLRKIWQKRTSRRQHLYRVWKSHGQHFASFGDFVSELCAIWLSWPSTLV